MFGSNGTLTVTGSGYTILTGDKNQIGLGGGSEVANNGIGNDIILGNGSLASLDGAADVTNLSGLTVVNFGGVPAPAGFANGTLTGTATFNSNGSGTLTTQRANAAQVSQTFATASQEYGEIGSTFGSSLGKILGGSNQFAQIAAGSVLGVLGQDAGTLIAGATTDGIDLDKVIGGVVDGNAFLSSLEGQGVGAISAYLVGELFKDIGLTGAPAQIVQGVASQAIGQIANNLIAGAAWNTGIDLGLELENVVDGFVGTELGDLVYSASTVQGAEGASVGSAVGGVIGSIIPGVGTLLGSFIGDIIGGLIGDLFGQAHTSHISEASFTTSTSGGGLSFTISSYQDGSLPDAQSIGEAVDGSLNSIITAVGGTITNAASLTQFGIGVNTDASPSTDVTGYYDSAGGMAYYYDANGVRNQYWAQGTSLGTVLDYAEARELSEIVFQGGDQYIERAIDEGLRSSSNPTMETISGDIQIAKDYETYEANKSVINALIQANPTSDFSAGWLAELEIASQMGFGTSIQGGSDDDTLELNASDRAVDHVLIGGGGNDTYILNSGDGNVTILNGVSTDNTARGALYLTNTGLHYTSILNPISATNNLRITANNSDLILETGTSDQIIVKGYFADSFATLSSINLADGTVIATTSVNSGIAGSNHFAGTNTISGGNGEDVLVGGTGANNFILGGGGDVVYGGGGADAYQLNALGQLTIYNNQTTAGGFVGSASSGTLYLNAGIGFDQLRAVKSLDGQDLYITVTGSSASVFVGSWFTSDAAQLNSIKTADGTTITYTDGNNYLHGATATNIYGISSAENYYFSGTTAFLVNYYNYANAEWEHDVVNSDGSSITTVELAGVGRIRDATTIIANAASDTLTGDGAGTSNTLWAQGGSSTAAGNDTLIGGAGTAMLLSDGYGETLKDGSGVSIAAYTTAHEIVNLATGTTTLGASTLHDTLIGMTVAQAAGASETLIGSAGTSTLVATGGHDSLVGGGTGAVTTLLGDGGSETLIAGAGTTRVGYATDNVAIDLTADKATVSGASVSDTLVGITSAEGFGNSDTLIGGTLSSALYAMGTGDTLVNGTGPTWMYGDTSTALSTIFIDKAGGGSIVAHGGAGVSNYQVNGNTAGLLTIYNGLTGGAPSGTLNLLGGITGNQLSFSAASNGDDLLIAVAGTTQVTVKNWFVNGYSQLQSITTSDGDTLTYAPYYGVLVNTTTPNIYGIYSDEYWDVTGIQSWSTTTDYYESVGTVLLETDLQNRDGTSSHEYFYIGGNNTGAAGTTSYIDDGANETLFAGSGVETLTALSSNDTLVAGSGVSTLIASGSNDTLFGNNSHSTLIGDATTKLVYYSGANYVGNLAGTTTLVGITAAVALGAHDTLIGAASGSSTLIGTGGNDTLIAGSGGATTLIGDGGGETLLSGAGAEVAVYTADSLTINLSTGVAKVNGSSLFDTLDSGIVQAAVYGNHDTAIAGGVTTYLFADGTNDTLIAGTAVTQMRGHANGSTLIANAGASAVSVAYYTDASTVINLVPTVGTAMDTGTGAMADKLIGITVATVTGANSTIVAGPGADTLLAGGTNDVLIGSAGATVMTSSSSTGVTNTLIAGSGLNTLTTAGAFDTLIGGTGATVLTSTALGAENTLIAGTGANTLTTSGNSDTLIGGSGADVLVSTTNGFDETLIAGSGVNTLMTAGTFDTLCAGTSSSTLIATGSQDTLIGHYGSAVYSGIAGDTTAYWGAGSVTVNLGGANISGITIATVTGTNDKLYGTTPNADTVTLTASGTTDTLVGGSGAVSQMYAYGTGDILTGGSAGNSYVRALGSGDTLIGGAGTAFLYGHANGSTLINGAGNTVAVYNDANSTVKLGTGTAIDTGTGAVADTLIGITVATIGGSGSYLSAAGAVADTLTGAGSNDTLVASTGASTLTATGSGDTLVAGAGASTLIARGTGSFYDVPSTAGAITIQNGATTNTTASNELDFGSGLTDEKLWFVHSGNDLVIDQLGTAKSVTVKGWFSNTYSQLSEITAGGLSLDTKVNQLVAAMATYSAAHSTFDPTTATVMPTDSTLQTAITTSWHS